MKKIIFITGWATDKYIWKGVTANLNYDYHIIEFNKCITETAKENKLYKLLLSSKSKVILVGWSLGSLIALKALLKYGSKIKKAVLISSTARMPLEQSSNYAGTNPVILRSMKNKLSKSRNQVLKNFFQLSINPGKFESIKLINMADKFDISELKNGLDYLLKTDIRNEIGEIKTPIKIFHGQQDKIISFQQSLFINSKIKSSKLEIISNANHIIPISYPDKILKAIID